MWGLWLLDKVEAKWSQTLCWMKNIRNKWNRISSLSQLPCNIEYTLKVTSQSHNDVEGFYCLLLYMYWKFNFLILWSSICSARSSIWFNNWYLILWYTLIIQGFKVQPPHITLKKLKAEKTTKNGTEHQPNYDTGMSRALPFFHVWHSYFVF